MDALFKTETFRIAGTDKVACLIAGYRGKIASYSTAVQALNKHGFTVIAYEHSPRVLKNGDPQDLLSLGHGIYKDFSRKIKNHKKVICVGASIGAGIGFDLQRRIPKARYGIYAGAGVSPSEAIFEAPLFYFVRKAFGKNGHDIDGLKAAWQEVEILPDTPLDKNKAFIIVLGKQDRIVKYQKALATLRAWQHAGVPIKIITKQYLGHRGTVRWFKKNLGSLLAEAEDNVN